MLGGTEVDASAVDEGGDGTEGGGVFGDLLGVADVELGVAEAGLGGGAGLDFGLGGAGDVDGGPRISEGAANTLPDAGGAAGDDDGFAAVELAGPVMVGLFPSASDVEQRP